MLNFGNKEFRNLQEQVLKNAQDIETLKGRENLCLFCYLLNCSNCDNFS